MRPAVSAEIDGSQHFLAWHIDDGQRFAGIGGVAVVGDDRGLAVVGDSDFMRPVARGQRCPDLAARPGR